MFGRVAWSSTLLLLSTLSPEPAHSGFKANLLFMLQSMIKVGWCPSSQVFILGCKVIPDVDASGRTGYSQVHGGEATPRTYRRQELVFANAPRELHHYRGDGSLTLEDPPPPVAVPERHWTQRQFTLHPIDVHLLVASFCHSSTPIGFFSDDIPYASNRNAGTIATTTNLRALCQKFQLSIDLTITRNNNIAFYHLTVNAGINENDTTDQDSDLEEVVIEHGDGWRCSGSLVSLRVVLTSARCGRPRGADLWALAGAGAGAGGARRVARAALAGAAGAAGPAPGLAALELEQPFGERAAARPILMATAGRAGAARAAGAAGAACHAARLLPWAGRPRLRVVRLTRARGAACARLPHWPAARDDLACLEGAVLCERDQGVGVVCQGMLYGVLSATVPAEARADEGCGEAHAAHVLSRWRRGECTSQCTEYDLLLLPSPPSSESPTISTPPRALNSMSTADLQVDVARSGPRDASSESGSRALPSRTTAPHDHWRSRSALQTNLTRTAAATTAATAAT
ncbi:unnamed protein product, partial [Leptidea sinapis]